MDDALTYTHRYSGLPVLVLGAGGFIGRRVSAALESTGARVHLSAPNADEILAAGLAGSAEPQIVDLRVEGAIVDLIHRVQPALVFNLAGYGVDPAERDEALAERLNAWLPDQIVRAIAGATLPDWPGVRLVHVGSALEYGEASGHLEEDSEPNPTTLYGRTKLAGTLGLQRACAKLEVAGATARAFMVYGPGERGGRLLPTLVERRGDGDPIEFTEGRQRRDFTHVDDIVEGLLRLGASSGERGEVLNLCTGRLTAVRDFVLAAARAFGIDEARLRFGALPTRREEMQHQNVAIERIEKRLGWLPSIDVERGLSLTLGESS